MRKYIKRKFSFSSSLILLPLCIISCDLNNTSPTNNSNHLQPQQNILVLSFSTNSTVSILSQLSGDTTIRPKITDELTFRKYSIDTVGEKIETNWPLNVNDSTQFVLERGSYRHGDIYNERYFSLEADSIVPKILTGDDSIVLINDDGSVGVIANDTNRIININNSFTWSKEYIDTFSQGTFFVYIVKISENLIIKNFGLFCKDSIQFKLN